MTKDKDRGQIQSWGIWILLQAEQEITNCLNFVGKSPDEICGLRGLCQLQKEE